jgi:hypothetical protein
MRNIAYLTHSNRGVYAAAGLNTIFAVCGGEGGGVMVGVGGGILELLWFSDFPDPLSEPVVSCRTDQKLDILKKYVYSCQ